MKWSLEQIYCSTSLHQQMASEWSSRFTFLFFCFEAMDASKSSILKGAFRKSSLRNISIPILQNFIYLYNNRSLTLFFYLQLFSGTHLSSILPVSFPFHVPTKTTDWWFPGASPWFLSDTFSECFVWSIFPVNYLHSSKGTSVSELQDSQSRGISKNVPLS